MTAKALTGVSLVIGLALPTMGRAEEAGTLASRGTAQLEKVPEVLRLTVDIAASGADVDQALASLKQKKEAAVKKLRDMGVAENAIIFDGPKPPASSPGIPGLGQTVRMVNGRMIVSGAPGAAEEDEDTGPPRTVVCLTLQAEWPLKGKDAEAVMREFHSLKTKVRAADLAGGGAKKGDKEAEENGEKPAPEATWRFVCRPSEAEQAKLLADAFSQARQRAEMLAQAAGVQLGSLASLESRELGVSENPSPALSAITVQRTALVRSTPAPLMDPTLSANNEIVGQEPHKIRCGVQVTVSYRLRG